MTEQKNVDTRNPEPFELVGGTDLREVFKDGQHAQGSFYINGVEMHQFDANSPASVVAQINAKSAAHFLTAEIDDGGHLVLVDRSGAEPVIRAGNPWQEPHPISTGDAIRDAVTTQTHIEKQRGDKADEKKKSVLEMLGLKAAKDDPAKGFIQPGFETGLSAADRKKRYEREILERDGAPLPPLIVVRQPGVLGSPPVDGPQGVMPTPPNPAASGGGSGVGQKPTHR